ncbi:hypothetical protein [Enterobacter hormaechei]|uniref:hypothetical protein n=1 Tax=Enterobacter hormaechei TaxID=158836 RepID=UPI001C9B4DA8|nr:hypothetical protein [Enterobacter hormaechei]MBY7159152.1 hypothetical protein [Enterobacter hormaechei]
MAIKIIGTRSSGNGQSDVFLAQSMRITCNQCGYAEVAKGGFVGLIKCPKCGGDSVSITSTAPQQEVK